VSRENDDEFNVARAELFDAMGHPNRIRIIKALAEKPQGFSELKKAVDMESSGLLAFHLGKLTHLVGTDQAGMYSLTDEGREALHIIQSTTDELKQDNSGRVSTRRVDRRSVILAAVVIGTLILAAVAVYQQGQITGLSKANASQSSEIVSPTMGMVLSNFTVTMTNATAKPAMFLYLRNDGQVPATSGSILVGVYGQGDVFQSCYNDSQNFFPILSHYTAVVLSQLSCGNLGDRVVVTAQVNFLTNSGNMTKTFNSQTTIVQSQFKLSTVVINQLGVRTFVTPITMENQSSYYWYLTLINESPTPIVAIHATLGPVSNPIGQDSGCVQISASNNPFPVSSNTPLTEFKSCSDDNSIPQGTPSLSVGQSLDVVISGKYSNGTAFSVSTKALVVLPYALVQ
jgi:DNA-binding HxlR family transcriptional regulator